MRSAWFPLAFALTGTALVLGACEPPSQPATSPTPVASVSAPTPPAASSSAPQAPAVPTYGAVARDVFNRVAVELNLPLYWTADRNGNQQIDPEETASLLFYPNERPWVKDGKFTADFENAYRQIQAWASGPQLPANLSPEEKQRRALVIQDLDQGRPTLVSNDFRSASAEQKALIGHMLRAAQLIDSLYAHQNGLAELQGKVPADDVPSQSLFRRNWGPKCVAPHTEHNAACSAVPGAPKLIVDVYPASLQTDATFCKALEKRPDAKTLLTPFTVVQEKDGKLKATAVTEAYAKEMKAISEELNAAAKEVTDPQEAPLKAYLLAAAKSFTDNNWQPADEAWAKMNAQNSKWYLRIAPDEVYWEPCSRKAGFHLAFAKINTGSLEWQKKLTPVQQDLEKALADLIGGPYKARKVSFHLPDFIDIVLNAGDDRDPMGATIGQSLPNWGPVANEGRGRTVAMSNLYTDPDSRRISHTQAESVLVSESMGKYTDSTEPNLFSTILHEATHNLGPAHEYKYQGKTDAQLLGGPLASTMEELKAQTGALWFIDLLVKKGIITQEFAQQTYVDNFLWALGHISRGMYTDSHNPKPYSHLAAIQLGFLLEQKAITFDPNASSANGKDKGAFTIHFDKLPAAVELLMKQVGTIKATGNKAAAEELVKKYVDGDVVPHKLIAERMLRYPKASFVYSLQM